MSTLREQYTKWQAAQQEAAELENSFYDSVRAIPEGQAFVQALGTNAFSSVDEEGTEPLAIRTARDALISKLDVTIEIPGTALSVVQGLQHRSQYPQMYARKAG